MSGTLSSKMSDNVDTLPVLWDMILAVMQLPFDIIPHFIQATDDGSKGFSFVVAEKTFDIFEK